jgi:regulatory protein
LSLLVTEVPTKNPSPRKKAMDLLARREHSVAELRAKLIAREFDVDEVDRAVARLAEEGLVSDERFAEAYVSSRVRKGQGPLRIRVELERRGVSSDFITTCLEQGDIDWDELARSVRVKKFGSVLIENYRDWARQARFLQYRGFTGDQISNVLGKDQGR